MSDEGLQEHVASGEERRPIVCMLAATPMLTETIGSPAGSDLPELHVDAGGQGLWVARMAQTLGPTSSSAVLQGARPATSPAPRGRGGPARHGDTVRRQLGLVRPRPARRRPDRDRPHRACTVGRHELDDLYGAVLVAALDADVVALGGTEPADVIPADLS